MIKKYSKFLNFKKNRINFYKSFIKAKPNYNIIETI